MKNFFRNNKILFLISFIIIAFIIFVLSWNRLASLVFNPSNQLAQIIEIETDLLKQWQQANGLKSTLAYKNNSNEVSLLQRLLAQDNSIYPEKEVTGYYGDLTKEAVKRFQGEYNLSQTGLVDTKTRDKINEIFLSQLCPVQEIVYPDFFERKVTKYSPLPKNYTPANLEDISDLIKTVGVTCVSSELVDNLKAMFDAAEDEEVYLAVTSGYRKPDIQKYLYDFWLAIEGPAALDEIAEPGSSEHQLGITVDLTDSSIGYAGVDDRFADSAGGQWLQENAHKYGFVMSYPKDKKEFTGYEFEPWHWRFVGVELARKLHNQKTTFNEVTLNKQKPYPRGDIMTGVNSSADAVLSIFVDETGSEYSLLEKNKEYKLPISNLTNLVVALVANDMFKSDDIVTLSQSAIDNKGSSDKFKTGDRLLLDDAISALLVGSHEEVAVAMAEKAGREVFLQRMNKKVQALGLYDTNFVNIVSSHSDTGRDKSNYSTATDLAKLLNYISVYQPSLFENLGETNYQLTTANSGREVAVENTSKLWEKTSLPLDILGASSEGSVNTKSNLVVISDSPGNGRIITVVLGSEDAVGDTEELLRYVKGSFVW